MTEIYKTPRVVYVLECDTDGNIRKIRYYREDIIESFVDCVKDRLKKIREEADKCEGKQNEDNK